MGHRRGEREVVYVERGGDASAKWLFWGALLGAGVALLYAPRSGEETRRSLQRTLWKLRAMTEEKIDELSQQFGGVAEQLDELDDEGEDVVGDYEAQEHRAAGTPRQELERRLAEARARRRSQADFEEPLA